jgi:hypothetical protein
VLQAHACSPNWSLTRAGVSLASVPVTRPRLPPFRGKHVAQLRNVPAGTSAAARHADPRTTMRYDRARQNLDRHANYILAAYMASSALTQSRLRAMPLSLLALHRDHHPVGAGKYPCPPPVRVKGLQTRQMSDGIHHCVYFPSKYRG